MPAVPRPHRKLLQQQQQPPAANGTAQTEPPPCTGAATQPGSATVAAAPTTNCSSSSSSSSSTPTGGGNGNSTSNTGGSAGSQNATSDAGIDGGGSSSGNGNATSGGGRLVCCCSDVAHPLPYRPQDDSSCCCGLESDCCAASDPISRMCTDKSGCGVVFIISGVGILCLLTSCAATGVLCRRCRRVSGEEEQPREAAGQPRRTAEDLECAGVMAMPPEKQAEVAVHGAAPGDAGFGASHECVICLEAVAVGPASWRTFPCHHGVCARCVDDIVRHNRRVMPAYNRVLHCPLCRKLAIVPEELLGKEMTSSVAAGSGGGPSSGGQDSAPATAAVVVVQPSRTELYRLVAAAAALRQLRLWLRRSAVEVSPGRESASAKGQLSFRKDPEPDGTAAGSASPSPATPLQHAREEQRVVLRVEVATKGQARFLTYSVVALNVVFAVLSIALFGVHQDKYITGLDLWRLYRGEMVVAAVCLAALLVQLAIFAFQMRQAQRERRVWSVRQKFFTRTAGLLLVLMTCYAACATAALASTVAQLGCAFPWTALAATDFLQWTFFSAILLVLLARMQAMTLWRGKGALDMQSDFRLLMDRPWADQLRSHAPFILLWLLLEALAVLGLVSKVSRGAGKSANPIYYAGCDVNLVKTGCPRSVARIVTAVISFIILVTVVWGWGRLVKRALRDHELLPYSRYKHTHICIRVQQRVITPVLTAVLLSLLFISIIPSLSTSCGSSGDVQVSDVGCVLALTVAAVVMSILYMPKNHLLDSPLVQEYLQDFSWTQADVQASVERRAQRLLASEATTPSAGSKPAAEAAEKALADAVAFFPNLAASGIAKMTGLQPKTVADAAEKLRHEPIFCIETAVRLFYWIRLAYRNEPNLDYEHINIAHGLSLFNLTQYELIEDDETDTHAVLAWNDSQVVVAFRGTASIENTLTDIKAWKITYPPARRRNGRLVRAHAGFAQAWLHAGFNDKVLSRVHELEEARPADAPPLRFWITGHSLGGALAVLASLDIARQLPRSQLTVYTYGAPRVGNSAFAAEQDEAVPDTWAILNGSDPIPWIPKVGFKRSGKRVSINGRGNLILRPSYFELSVMERGTKTKDHMTGSYAQSLMAICKAQFVESKAFPGGPEGVEALSRSVDIGRTLVLLNADVASLRDPKCLPISAEAQAKICWSASSGRTIVTELGVGTACLLVQLAMLCWLAASVRRCRLEGRLWSVRQQFFTRTAATLLVLQTCYTAAWTASFAIVLAQPGCGYPWRTITVFDFLQSLFFVSALMFMLARIRSMTLWRGKGALDMHPDYRLTMDRPLQAPATASQVMMAAWAVLVCLNLARMIQTLASEDALGRAAFQGDCTTPLSDWTCEATDTQVAAAVVSLVFLILYLSFWAHYLLRALRDHAGLPYCRYRSTLVFTRVQQRVLVPVLVAITISVVLLSLLPVLASSTCWGLVDSQLGNLTVYLSMTVAAVVLAALYSPKSAVESPLLQELLQDFSWTRAAIPAGIERRCEQLLACEGLRQAAPPQQSPPPQADAPSAARATPAHAQLPAVKLFYWTRLAYREEDALTHPFVNARSALPLFALRHFETTWDEGTDTHAVLGWSGTQVVVAFRGTQTLQNVVTDAKSWRARVPGRTRFGRPLLVHAGFLDAWHHSGFHRKVLDRLQQLDSGPTPLRFWLTGHSLGGALAVLAALDIRREHPGSELVLYAFGCPRVGNCAFAAEFDEVVPDAWMVINGLDPIPWVPKIGYKTAGKRATVSLQGGTSSSGPRSYALSMAAVCKAQFAASKALPGGPEGVAVLSAAVPLGRTLVLAHVDLESLENPELLPVSSEVLAARNAQSVASLSRASSPSAGGWCGWGGTRGGEGGGGGGSAPCEGVAQQPAAAVPPPGSSASVGKRREHRLQWQQQQVLHLGPPSPERGASAAAAAEGGAACTLPSPSGLHEDVHLTHYPTMLLGLNSSGSVDAGDRAAGSGATDGEPGPCMPRPA
ncbi:alpha beta-hydrolase isoform B [Micractinium conductrix]|uniref:Alpha beta-hydrolase isoform B n=1 Tax=Micractinium conductrix TaxID=554055 RepID=A0A2P6V4P7_9CHLO|nr:alpha beta-hydrolase isoform B [Micractinium conductrix]|eukprot:PSC69058.1 alpha beta-hydrolase isoform B [Micractinium conductrix]